MTTPRQHQTGGDALRRRRGRNEGSIYKDEARGRWYGAVSLGYGPDGKTWRRHKISGKTRAEVAEKLKQLQAERDSGVQPAHPYTVQRAVNDWLAEGLDGRSAGTVTLNRHILKPVTAVIGGIELRKLTAHDVRRALVQLAQDHSSRTVTIAHNALTRAIRHAEAKSRRTLGMPHVVIEALREHRVRRDEEKAAAGELWKDTGLVFTYMVGTELDAANVRRYFRSICWAAGIGEDWAPRELRTSFVSLLSASGMPVEEIARLAGHSSSRTTEVIYRKELRSVLVRGAEVMDQIFG